MDHSAQAVAQFFAWCEMHRVRTLGEIKPVVVAAYIEHHPAAAPTVKQHLAAIRMLFDFLVIGQIVPMNPAASVRGPKHVVHRGNVTVLGDQQRYRVVAGRIERWAWERAGAENG